MRNAGFLFSVFVAITLAAPTALAVDGSDQIRWLGVGEAGAPASAEARVTAESAAQVEVGFQTPGVFARPIATADETEDEYVQLSIPGCGTTAEQVGWPEMPFKGFFLEIPYDVDVVVALRDGAVESLGTGYRVYPMQPAQPDSGEEVPVFQVDGAAYATDAFFPAAPVVISEPGFIRGRRVVFAQVFPLQYNPVTTELRAFTSLSFALTFEGGAGAIVASRKGRLATAESENLAQQLILNYAPADEGVELSEADLSTGAAADYLIIVADALAGAVTPLAEWKHRKGFVTRMATMSEVGSTAADVKSYIQNAYNTWTPAPSYVLLVGDAQDVPPDYFPGTYECTSDHPYACVDGTDDWADLTLGRLPVHTTTECTNVVNKILQYDRTPNLGDWYGNFLAAAYFQDDDGDRIADRYFMETAMTAYDFLVTEQGWGGYTALCTNSPAGGTYHFRSTATYPHREALNLIRWGVSPYPDPVPTWIVDRWTSATQARTDITAAINAGVGLVLHRDHGGETNWGDPPYSVTQINGLTNGVRTPVVLSLNCLTGSFHRTSGDCFCEAFIKKNSGGSVGIVGSTQVSYSGYNDLIAHGIFRSFWPSYDPSYTNMMYPTSPRTAGALDFGKYYMLFYRGATSIAASEFHMFHWFGDPEMPLRTSTPHTLAVSHPAKVAFGQPADVTINVMAGGLPVENALVCISHAGLGAHHAGATNGSGEITFSGIILPDKADYDLVVTARDGVPYEGTILTTDYAMPDFNGDNDVDLADFAVFQACFNGPNRLPVYSSCGYTDVDRDGDVDLADFGLFSRCFNGPNRSPACE